MGSSAIAEERESALSIIEARSKSRRAESGLIISCDLHHGSSSTEVDILRRRGFRVGISIVGKRKHRG